MEHDKQVDESWKDETEKLKQNFSEPPETSHARPGNLVDALGQTIIGDRPQAQEPSDGNSATQEAFAKQEGSSSRENEETIEVNFLNYVTSLGFQAMIFLGEIPNPATQENEQNLKQAKLLIDTLIMLRNKTKGNLSVQEENLLNGSIYELQMKYIELSKTADE